MTEYLYPSPYGIGTRRHIAVARPTERTFHLSLCGRDFYTAHAAVKVWGSAAARDATCVEVCTKCLTKARGSGGAP